MVATDYYLINKRKVLKIDRNKNQTMIYYADGGGVAIQHSCGNKSYFSHSYTDPNLPTGGYY